MYESINYLNKLVKYTPLKLLPQSVVIDIYEAHLQSDSSVPESRGSPKRFGTCGPHSNSQWVMSISTNAGTVRKSSVGHMAGESDHNRDGPTHTPRLAADMRL